MRILLFIIKISIIMNVLIYGSNGWIGKQFTDLMDSEKINYVKGLCRVDENDTLIGEIDKIKPTHIVSFIGRTHGQINDKVYQTIDYLEIIYILH